MKESRRAREVARTRADILEAAARAFVRSGFKAVTMQEIAKEAGYTAASLYGYFESKEEILAELRNLVLQELQASFESSFPEGLSFRQKLDLLFRRQVEIAKQRFEVMAMLHAGTLAGEIQAGNPDIQCQREVLYVDFIRSHATEEDLGGHAPEDIALAISGIGMAFFARWVRDPQPGWLESKLPFVLDLLFEGMASGKKEETSPARTLER